MATKTGTGAAKARAQKASGAYRRIKGHFVPIKDEPSRQIKIQFTLDPESGTGRRFGLAVQHYSGGALLAEDFGDAVAKLIVADWLEKAVTFPTLWLGGCSVPQEIERVGLTAFDLVEAFGSDQVLKRGQLASRLVNMRLCSYQSAMRAIMPGAYGYLAKHLETTAAGSLRLKLRK